MIDTINILELLGILLTILALFSVGIYYVLSWKIKQATLNATDELISLRNAKLFLAIGFNYWFQFTVQKDKDTTSMKSKELEHHKKNQRELLEQAFKNTEYGIEECETVDKEKREEILGVLRNNYAYFLTELDDPVSEANKQIARKYAKHLEEISIKYHRRIEDWGETIDTVMRRFPEKKI